MLDLRDAIKDDWAIFDNQEDISFIVNATQTNNPIPVSRCLRRAPEWMEAGVSAGVYTKEDLAWIIPFDMWSRAQTDGLDPKASDIIKDGDGNQWTVLSVRLNTLRSWYRCMTRNLVLVYGLRDTIKIIRPVEKKDVTGSRTANLDPIWDTAVYEDIPAKIQEISGEAEDERGKKGPKRAYTVYLGRRLTVNPLTDLVRDENDVDYQIMSYSNPDRIDEVMQLAVEIRA